ncbi:hypothetical protein QT972_00045 [Microcoleus sp. herbarium7]|uniref:hypothetical protein n=1 Tax=Microcoleus sp. herbarium7 TaxID=3055435 RepID=UPI002FD6994B
MYTKHQKIAAEIAEGSIETPLSQEEILIVAATETLGISPPAQAKQNWDSEHSMSAEELAEHYIAECKRLRPYWTNILRG